MGTIVNFREKQIDNIKIGLIGMEKVRLVLDKHRLHYMEEDIMYKNTRGEWVSAEVKTQEKYLAPPFDGHGLPKWQIDTRLELSRDTGIIPWLFVYCLDDRVIYHNDLRVLMEGEHFQTRGAKPRVIFKLDEFKTLRL